jgi:hypothetical protein
LYCYSVSQSSEFCRHNPLCCFSTSNTKGKRIFRYRLSPETFGYTLVLRLRCCVVQNRSSPPPPCPQKQDPCEVASKHADLLIKPCISFPTVKL